MAGRTIMAILGVLTVESMTGYEIKKFFNESVGYFWAESDGQIYPQLAKCVEQGFAKVKEGEIGGNNLPKKKYSITAKGKKHLSEWLRVPAKKTNYRNELLLKMFFGDNLPVSENILQLQYQLKSVNNKMDIYLNIKKEILAEKNINKYHLMTLNYGIEHLKCEIKWLKESLKLLASE